MHPTPTTRKPRRAAGVLALAAAALTALALAGPAGAQAATINVSASTGSDANPGTATAPLKTLTKALSKSVAGDTVKLAGGGYGQSTATSSSGEQIPAAGLAVPSGVTIEGATSSGFPVATLLGQGSGVGLRFAGDATVRNLFIGGGAGFDVDLLADQGTQTFSNLFLASRGGLVLVDGKPVSGAIALQGTARATLLAGASEGNTTGSTLFVNGGTGVVVRDQSELTMGGGQINANQFHGARVEQHARFTMDGGAIVGAAGATCPTGTGLLVQDSAQVTLKNRTKLTNLETALKASGASKATLSAAVTKAYKPGCLEGPSISGRFGSASLTLDRTTLTTTGGQTANDVGITTGEDVALTLKQSKISGHAGAGLDLDGDGLVTVETSQLSNNRVGIDTTAVAGALPQIAMSGSFLTRNDTAVLIRNGQLRLRNSRVILNRIGIRMANLATAANNGSPSGPACVTVAACANLGTAPSSVNPAGDPGRNDLSANTETAVSFSGTGHQAVSAVGNVWNPNTQGADSSGVYPHKLVVVSNPGGGPNGTNFRLAGDRNEIELGPTPPVGTFRLSPRTLIARPGRPARWRLAWTHPVAWKQLDRVVLRLQTARGEPVGRVVLDQQTRRVRASGSAVRLAGGRGTRVGGRRGGKRMSATLRLRIARRYAGRTLVASVAARDDNGARQGFRRAGRVRVLGL